MDTETLSRTALDLRHIVRGFMMLDNSYIDEDIFQDSFSNGLTGMIINPEDRPGSREELLNVLIAKTRYHTQLESNTRRDTERVRVEYVDHADLSGDVLDHVPTRYSRPHISHFAGLPLEFLRTLPTRMRTAATLLGQGMTYPEVAELMGVKVIEGLVSPAICMYEEWLTRETYELTDTDRAALAPPPKQRRKNEIDYISIAELLLKGYKTDIVCHLLGIPVKRLQFAQTQILHKLPHLRQFIGVRTKFHTAS